MRRRDFFRKGLAVGLGATVGGSVLPQRASTAKRGRLKQSVSRWCYSEMSLGALCRAAKEIGLQSVELLGPEEWPVAQKHGLTCAMANGPEAISIEKGFNRLAHHDELLPAYEKRIRAVAEAGLPNVICFSGNREDLSDEEGLANCARGLRQLMPVAEQHGVTVCMELLNSKVDHPGYQADRTTWGAELVQRVGSERLKLLYDIYHMQIMEGDVIRTIRTHSDAIAHYHTAGVPGRHEIDETQELNYRAIMEAIRETGFRGYIGQEFIPTKNPLAALQEAVQICDV